MASYARQGVQLQNRSACNCFAMLGSAWKYLLPSQLCSLQMLLSKGCRQISAVLSVHPAASVGQRMTAGHLALTEVWWYTTTASA